jgi:hypothetical protein
MFIENMSDKELAKLFYIVIPSGSKRPVRRTVNNGSSALR